MSDDTSQVTPQCFIRWGASVPAETRQAILGKALAIRPAAPRRPHSYERARKLAADAAEERLTARDPECTGTQWFVRVYYRSIGDEILCFDAGPMTRGSAARLESQCNAPGSMSLGADGYTTDPNNGSHMYPGARLVTLPSQHTSPVQVVSEPVVAPVLTLCEPLTAAPTVTSEPRVYNTYWGEAMAKRTARFQRMHRRASAA